LPVTVVASPHQRSSIRIDIRCSTLGAEHLYGYVDVGWSFAGTPGRGEFAAMWATSDSFVFDVTDTDEPSRQARSTPELIAIAHCSALNRQSMPCGDIRPGKALNEHMDGTEAPSLDAADGGQAAR
jgi:hypothetical protein